MATPIDGSRARRWPFGAALVGLGVGCGCARSIDVAGYVETEAAPDPAAAVKRPVETPTTSVDAAPPESENPAANGAVSTPVTAADDPDAATAPLATYDGGPPFFRDGDAGAFDDGYGQESGWPMGWEQGEEGDGLWVSGWPLEEWTDVRVSWPLEVTLEEFFGPSNVESGYQVGVWVRGEQAETLAAWWNSLESDAPGTSVLEGRRFAATEDLAGSIFAVSAEAPPDDTEFLFPIPDGT